MPKPETGNSHATPPVMITGVRTDAAQAVRKKIRFQMFAVRPEKDALALDAYLKSLKPVASPYLVKGKLSESAKRGKKLFHTAKCSSCHSGPMYTDMKLHDVGTGINREKGKNAMTSGYGPFWVDNDKKSDILLYVRLGGVAERQVTIHFCLEAKS